MMEGDAGVLNNRASIPSCSCALSPALPTPVFYLPKRANIPSNWVIRTNLYSKTITFPSGKPSETEDQHYEITMDLETRRLTCTCLGFRYHHHCFHITELIRIAHRLRESGYDTRVASYHDFSPEELCERQLIVLETIKMHGPMSDRSIADFLGWDRCSVTGRRNELMEMGQVAECGIEYDIGTRRHVKVWMAVSEAVRGDGMHTPEDETTKR